MLLLSIGKETLSLGLVDNLHWTPLEALFPIAGRLFFLFFYFSNTVEDGRESIYGEKRQQVERKSEIVIYNFSPMDKNWKITLLSLKLNWHPSFRWAEISRGLQIYMVVIFHPWRWFGTVCPPFTFSVLQEVSAGGSWYSSGFKAKAKSGNVGAVSTIL